MTPAKQTKWMGGVLSEIRSKVEGELMEKV